MRASPRKTVEVPNAAWRQAPSSGHLEARRSRPQAEVSFCLGHCSSVQEVALSAFGHVEAAHTGAVSAARLRFVQ
jgi:hypothetical protein